MPHPILEDSRKKMDKSVIAFQEEMGGIRTGRASATLMDVVDVEVYGQMMKLNQMGTISVPDAHLIVIDLWDKTQMGTVEKAIMTSALNLNPSNDGKLIRIPIPALTEERRKDLVKMASKHVEEAKVAIRNIRRHAIEEIKKQQKDGDIPEDDAHRMSDEVQKLTDVHTKSIDEAFASKEKDIMEV